MIPAGFLGALVFALVFFGVYSLRDCALSAGPPRAFHIAIALVFILSAWVLAHFFLIR